MQLASRAAARDAMVHHSSRIVGYRRVTDGNACRRCLLASTQRYHVGDLLPIHPRCGCTVVPIVGTTDPGHVIDEETLRRLNDGDLEGARDAARRFNEEVEIGDHGELGPVLQPAGAHPTPVRVPGPQSKPLVAAFEFEGSQPGVYRELLDDISGVHGLAPGDALSATRTKVLFRKNPRANARKGGHFTPASRGPKPRRKKGESYTDYATRARAWAARPVRPEILVVDRGGDNTDPLSFLHELGHRIDAVNQHVYASRRGAIAAAGHRTVTDPDAPLWDEFFTAARATPTIRDAAQHYRDPEYLAYFRSPEEIWARAYSQWAAGVAKHPSARAALDAMRTKDARYQWPDDEFATLASLVERVLRARGLMR
jgi:hypothetical protein